MSQSQVVKITVYTKPGCSQCDRTKQALKRARIDFTEVNLTEHPSVLEEIRKAGYKKVPIVAVDSFEDSRSWSGYKPGRMNELAANVRRTTNRNAEETHQLTRARSASRERHR